jgi:hypothetical protein
LTELSELPHAERVKRYRELEQQALRDTKNSIGATAEAFLNLAKAWARLAEITEGIIARAVTEIPDGGVEQKEAALRTQPESSDPEFQRTPKST